MKTTILSQIEELKNTATKTGLLYSNDKVMFAYFKDVWTRLNCVEELIKMENDLHLTEVGDALRDMFKIDPELTHIQIDLQVRPIQTEVKKGIIKGKIYNL